MFKSFPTSLLSSSLVSTANSLLSPALLKISKVASRLSPQIVNGRNGNSAENMTLNSNSSNSKTIHSKRHALIKEALTQQPWTLLTKSRTLISSVVDSESTAVPRHRKSTTAPVIKNDTGITTATNASGRTNSQYSTPRLPIVLCHGK